jgi:hypothetical protein
MLRHRDRASDAYIVTRRLAVGEFKLCPLCRAVNLLDNEVCFCCQWEGRFDHDANHIESALYEMIYRCPELLGILVEDEPVERPGFFERVWSFFGRLRRLDLRA